VVESLTRLLGLENVLDAPEDRRFFSHDIYSGGVLPLCVIRPAGVEQLADSVRRSTEAGLAVIARGGGSSYTGGYRPTRERTILVDTQRLDRVVEINADDMYVTVETGVTWRALNDALAPLGLRTPFWGPLSGAVATVGGTLSQNGVLWGSARHGASPESVLGLDVVLASGALLSTGSAGSLGFKPFFRHYGPDLTGVFLGDAGALGVKARATLRLIRRPRALATASFGFPSHTDLASAMAEIARENLVAECFGMDPDLQRQRMKRTSLAADVKALAGVFTSAASVLEGAKGAARVVAAGRSFLDGVDFSMHACVEGRDEGEVRSGMREVREICERRNGHEVADTIPKVLRGDPFVPMSSSIGPRGERWAPVHGVVALSDAVATWSAVRALFDAHREALDRHGVVIGVLTAIAGPTALVIEPVFYWPGPRTPFHERVLDPATLARFTDFPETPAASALVAELRTQLLHLFKERGAAHMQVGKAYLYREGRRPEGWALMESLKDALDPKRLMNPGALGLD
jgi:FAD/FMN-containing dehydrogenase